MITLESPYIIKVSADVEIEDNTSDDYFGYLNFSNIAFYEQDYSITSSEICEIMKTGQPVFLEVIPNDYLYASSFVFIPHYVSTDIDYEQACFVHGVMDTFSSQVAPPMNKCLGLSGQFIIDGSGDVYYDDMRY